MNCMYDGLYCQPSRDCCMLWCLQCHQLTQSEDSAQTCCIVWVVPENIETVVTLFRDPRRCEFEDKDWSFSIEVTVNSRQSTAVFCLCISTAIHFIHTVIATACQKRQTYMLCHIKWINYCLFPKCFHAVPLNLIFCRLSTFAQCNIV